MTKQYVALLFITSVLSACSLAPDFVLPEMALPATYKADAEPMNAEKEGVWQAFPPMEDADRGRWWKIFNEPELDALQTQAADENQSLKVAANRLEQSRADVRSIASTLFPTISLDGNAVRAKSANSSNAPFGEAARDLKPYNLYSTDVIASYEVDLFGRVRDNEAALGFDADGQEALYRSILLALQADVATHYFNLRTLDAERALLRETVSIRTEAQRIMQKRFDVGVVGAQDLSRTQAELAGAQAELLALDRVRAGYENALAVLLGKMPSTFHFTDITLAEPSAEKLQPNLQPPVIPAGLPSTLLMRRSDVARAQTAMQAANKRIGVARAAFFPTLDLTLSGGTQSTDFADLFTWSSRSWALGQTAGSALAMTLFDNGRRSAKVDSAQVAYEASVSDYRQQVLVAFKEVEDALNAQRLLAEQSTQQDIEATAAKRSTQLTIKRYDQGDTNYFEVVDAQRSSLAAERAAIQIRGARMLAAVNLVRALGGGWEQSRVKTE